MQILFISEEAQIVNFLSGGQAEAIMAQGDVEVRGMATDSVVTVICSGVNASFQGTITGVVSGYTSAENTGSWLSMKFMVRRIIRVNDYDLERAGLR